MQSVQPASLSNEELERGAFIRGMPHNWALEMAKRLRETMDAPPPADPDPRQLNLFDDL